MHRYRFSTGSGPAEPPVTEPQLVAPTANTPVMETYTSPAVDMGGYTISFSFNLCDGVDIPFPQVVIHRGE